MNTLLIVAAITCGIIGLLGAIIPVLPGTLLSLAGLILAYFTDGSEITVNMLIKRKISIHHPLTTEGNIHLGRINI